MDLAQGILNALSLSNLIYCFLGCLLGTLVGVIPGLGPSSTLSILLPLTMSLDPTGAIIMMAGLFYGANYGGSTTSILVNIPGEASSVPSCYDGYAMTKQGRGGEALWIAAFGSFLAGTMGCLLLSLIGPEIAKYAFKFGPPEYFWLLFFSMTAAICVAGSSAVRGLVTAVLGLILATFGTDPCAGTQRFVFGSVQMMRGLDVVPLVVGLFGISEILVNSQEGLLSIYQGKLGRMTPTWPEFKKGLMGSIRGTLLGLPLGILPGMVTAVTSFMAYDLEKKISKYPDKFGSGVIEGVAAPEAANNATAQSGFIPLLSLGIPTGAAMAIMLAALMMYGLVPGPMLFVKDREFAWTVIGSMYIGNVMLLILNLPLVGLWAKISLIPNKYLGPIILGVCVIGAYSPRNSMFDVWIAIVAGIIGYLMKKFHWPTGPLILGFILGPILERSLRQSLSMGGPWTLFNRPVAAVFIVATVIVILLSLRLFRRVPKQILEGDPGAS